MTGRNRGMGGPGAAALVIVAAVWLPLACTDRPVPPSASISTPSTSSGQPPSPGPTEPPYHQLFGPSFAADPPIGGLVRIDGAFLSHDRRKLTVEFVGSHAYLPTNPCSKDYQAWATIDRDVLTVEVVNVGHPDQATLAPEGSCESIGFGYLFVIQLPEPFTGSTVRNGSEPLWVPVPERVAELTSLPPGWQLSRVTTSVATQPEFHELLREYLPGLDVPGPRDRSLGLGQVFDGPPGWELHEQFATGIVLGTEVPIGRNGDIGYMVNWDLDGDGMTLISYDPDLSVKAFVAMANGVAVPAP